MFQAFNRKSAQRVLAIAALAVAGQIFTGCASTPQNLSEGDRMMDQIHHAKAERRIDRMDARFNARRNQE